MEYEGEEYMGALLFTDSTFCGQVYELPAKHCGFAIADIGGLEVGHLA